MDLSPATVCNACSNLRKKGTTVKKLGSGQKSYKTKECINKLKRLLIQQDIHDLTALKFEMCKAGF